MDTTHDNAAKWIEQQQYEIKNLTTALQAAKEYGRLADEQVVALERENAKLREALEKVLSWRGGAVSTIHKIARAALKTEDGK